MGDLMGVGYGFTRTKIRCGEKQTTNIRTNTNPIQQKREISNKHRNTHPSKAKAGYRHQSDRRNANARKRKKQTIITKGGGTTTHHKKEKRQSQQQHLTKTPKHCPLHKARSN